MSSAFCPSILAPVQETGEVVEGGFASVVGGGAFHV